MLQKWCLVSKQFQTKYQLLCVCICVCVMGICYLSSFGNTNEKRMLKLQTENTMEFFSLDLKTYSKGTITKTAWHFQKNKK